MKNVFTKVGIGFFVAFIIALALAVLASIVLIIGAGIGGCATQTFVRNEYIECEVTDKESITQDGGHRYLIYCETKDGEIKVFDGKDGYVSMNQIINKINIGHITDLHFEVLNIVNELGRIINPQNKNISYTISYNNKKINFTSNIM